MKIRADHILQLLNIQNENAIQDQCKEMGPPSLNDYYSGQNEFEDKENYSKLPLKKVTDQSTKNNPEILFQVQSEQRIVEDVSNITMSEISREYDVGSIVSDKTLQKTRSRSSSPSSSSSSKSSSSSISSSSSSSSSKSSSSAEQNEYKIKINTVPSLIPKTLTDSTIINFTQPSTSNKRCLDKHINYRLTKLSNLDLKRTFIKACMMDVKPKYKYTNASDPRKPNTAFYFTVDGKRIRVCKTSFINTLDITERQIRTVRQKSNRNGFVEEDLRDRSRSRASIDPTLVQNIKDLINSIPRIESHYLRSSTTREYIDGSKSVKELCRDFNTNQTKDNKPHAPYWIYYLIFTTEFNIAFFKPKKDLCDQCTRYELASADEKLGIQEKYEKHMKEKDLCREEKRTDRCNINETNICAVYDLEAAMPCPKGDISSFYYRSRLNCYNFSIVEFGPITNDANKQKRKSELGAYREVYCYFWNETQGHYSVLRMLFKFLLLSTVLIL